MKGIESILLLLLLCGVLTSCSDSTSGNSIIDEPETPEASFDLCNPKNWSLASVPALFPEASLINDVAYGKNRALLAWYTIDRLFTKRGSADAPGYIKNDLDALSYPYAREVAINEVFPGRDINYGESSVIQTLNLSFYPRERGPYNLDATNVDVEGYLLYPEMRWGGIMCKIDNTNFEQAGIKYIQFWMLDPFMDPELDNQDGGLLYFNLGDVSEDVLKDGLKSYENGLPANGVNTNLVTTVWGRVSNLGPVTYAYDNTSGARIHQDVGLDGLINQDEYTHPSYANYLNKLRAMLSESTYLAMLNDPFSPFNDPAGDNYAYCLHNYYDLQRSAILERYKHYNGTDGNSLSQSDAADSQYQQARSTPDTEDVNNDNTLNENERYFQYRIAIHPDSMLVGRNYITDKRVAKVHTRNGEIQVATWYHFMIPLADYERKFCSIQDFSNIRFMRVFMTGFSGITHLRFATLKFATHELARGE